jgi:hypothetical protein
MPKRVVRNLKGKGAPGKPKKSFKEALLAMPNVGDDSDFDRARQTRRRVELTSESN